MRRYLFLPPLLLWMAALLLIPQQAASAVRDGLTLCGHSVVPALFPFFVASSLFISLGYAQSIGCILAPLLRPLLGCSESGAAVFFLGLIGGYPVGARSIAQLRRHGHCSLQEAEQLLCCCNNAGPAFILGIAGDACFHSGRKGMLLYLIHVLSALLTGMLLRRGSEAPSRPSVSPPPFSRAFVDAIRGGAESMVQISGFVVFFQVLLQLLPLKHPLFLGLVELTAGIFALPDTAAGFICCAALLGWGGLSVHCQTASALSGTDIPLWRYLLAKLLQGTISALLAIPLCLRA